MLKKALAIFLILCLAAGCSAQTPSSRTYSAEDVRIVNDPSSGVKAPPAFSLGDVKFEADTAKSVSGCTAQNQDLVLTAQDASGAEWTLTIPASAVPAGTTITMTPLINIQSAGYIGKMKGGVLFEPDGQMFNVPGTLAVKLPAGTNKSVMLSGDQQGKGISLMDGSQGTGTIVSSIEHFSSAYFDTVDSLVVKNAETAVERGFKELRSQIKEFLKTPLVTTAPTEIILENFSDRRFTQARIYAYQAMQPETDLLKQVLDYNRAMNLLGSEKGISESLEYARALVKRQLVKAYRVLKESNQEPLKFLSSTTMALACCKNAELLGAEKEYSDSLLETIKQYAHTTAVFCLNELKDNHNYKYIRAADEIGQISTTLGNQEDAQQAQNACKFRVEFELTVVDDDHAAVNDWVVATHLETVVKGTADLKIGRTAKTIIDPITFKGSGTGDHTFKWTDNSTRPWTFRLVAENPTFNVDITKFDPGETDTVQFRFDRLWAEKTALVEKNYDGSKEITRDNYLFVVYTSVFKQFSPYEFSAKLQNNNVTAAEINLSKKGVAVLEEEVTLHIKLVHTP